MHAETAACGLCMHLRYAYNICPLNCLNLPNYNIADEAQEKAHSEVIAAATALGKQLLDNA